MMTLMALSLVIGILIDDAVVVRENIYRHMEHGEDPMTAARKGTSEIGLAVMATTFTILAVFLPVGFMTGIVGQFFKSFALTIAFAVSMSLLVAFTLDPMLSSRFVRFVPPEERMRTRIGRLLERVGPLLRPHRRAVPRACSAGRSRIRGQSSRWPAGDLRGQPVDAVGDRHRVRAGRRSRRVRGAWSSCRRARRSSRAVPRGEQVEQDAQDDPEVRQVFSHGRRRTASPLQADRCASRPTKKHEREARARGPQGRHARAAEGIPLLKITVADPEFMQGAPTQAPISVYVRGDDMNELQRLSDEIVAKIKAVPGAVDVDSTLESGQPEMVAHVNRALAADLGFDVGSVGDAAARHGRRHRADALREGDKEYDIRVRLAPEFRNDFETIARTPLYSPTGAVVRAARHRARWSPASARAAIDREQRRRQAKIGVELAGRAARRRHGRRRRR